MKKIILSIIIVIQTFVCSGQFIFNANVRSYHAETKAFYDSAKLYYGINALETLVSQLKDSSLWSTFIAFYPTIGYDTTSFKLNLINPANTTAAFRKNFNTSLTSLMTCLLNKINYGDSLSVLSSTNTHIIPNTSFALNNIGISMDVQSAQQGAADVFGCYGASSAGYITLRPKTNASNHVDAYINLGAKISQDNFTAIGYHFLNRRTGYLDLYSNGILFNSQASTAASLCTFSIYENNNNYNNTNGGGYYNGVLGLSTYGTGLSSTQIASLNRIIQLFKTQTTKETNIDVWILIGDSNGSGRISLPNLPTAYKYGQYGFVYNKNLGIYRLGWDNVQTWTYDSYKGVEMKLGLNFWNNNHKKILIFKNCKGSTYLNIKTGTTNSYSPTDTRHNAYDGWYNFKTSWTAFQSYISGLGISVNVKGLIIEMGANDATVQADANAYQTNLGNLIDSIRTYTNNPNLYTILPQVRYPSGTYTSTVNTAILNVANSKSNCKYFAKTWFPLQPDSTHLTQPGLERESDSIYYYAKYK